MFWYILPITQIAIIFNMLFFNNILILVLCVKYYIILSYSKLNEKY